MTVSKPLIDSIRSASRLMVRELGFMRTTLANTDYSPSAVHALLEMEARGSVTAAQLVNILGLEKSSVSRMVRKLIKAGEIMEAMGEDDGRVKLLSLTNQGVRTVAEINSFARAQVAKALAQLSLTEQPIVAQGLGAYAQALRFSRCGESKPIQSQFTISTGYRSGVIGRVTEMHSAYYSHYSGFGQFFESKVASGVAEFVGRLDDPANAIWTLIQNERIVGSIAIDGQDLGKGRAHLRWFIADDGCRGCGAGRKLLDQAVCFCDKVGFEAIHLWTFKGLDAARRLYESFGFELIHEEQGSQWGCLVTEQEFVRSAT